MNRLLISFAVVAAVTCNDLIQGPEGGRKIYEANQEASPALWKQKQEFTIKTNDSEVISRIIIQDRRPQKDGEAKIIAGGQGKENVTIELSSPTVFRGYDFHIEVYAAEDNGQQIAYPVEQPMYNDTAVNYHLEKDDSAITDAVTGATKDKPMQDKVQAPVTTGQEKVETPAMAAKEQDKVVALVTDRKTRNTDQDTVNPTVQGNVNKSADKAVTGMSVTTDKTTNKPPVDAKMTTEKPVTQKASLNLTKAEDSNKSTPSRPQMTSEEDFKQLYGVKAFNNFRDESSEQASTTQGFSVNEMTGSAKVQPEVFKDISKELGQNVVFGIKHV